MSALIVCVASAMICFFLSKYKRMHIVFWSSLSTLILCLLIEEKAHNYIFLGSFVGMSSRRLFTEKQIFLAAVISTVVFYFGDMIFPSVGGKLGFCAFLGVLVAGLFRDNRDKAI